MKSERTAERSESIAPTLAPYAFVSSVLALGVSARACLQRRVAAEREAPFAFARAASAVIWLSALEGVEAEMLRTFGEWTEGKPVGEALDVQIRSYVRTSMAMQS